MSTLGERIIQKLYTTSKINEVYSIIADFFGEDRVDMSKPVTEEIFKEEMSVLFNEKICNLFSKTTVNNDIYCELEKNNASIYDTLFGKYSELIEEGSEEEKQITRNIKFRIEVKRICERSILIYFPVVKVTNEFGSSIIIKELYAKINVSIFGKLTSSFTLNRTEYDYAQFKSNYMHSHVPGINKLDFTEFSSCCKGSGPIVNTTATLIRDFDAHIWQLFCAELNNYVQVESIAGRPYKRLEEVNAGDKVEPSDYFVRSNTPYFYVNSSFRAALLVYIKDVINYILENRILKFNYINGAYHIAMPYAECIMTISDAFIKVYNNKCKEKSILLVSLTKDSMYESSMLMKVIYKNNTLYRLIERSDENINDYINSYVLTFKGEQKYLNITNIESISNDNTVTIVNPQLCMYIITRMLRFINYYYGKELTTDASAGEVSKDSQDATIL